MTTRIDDNDNIEIMIDTNGDNVNDDNYHAHNINGGLESSMGLKTNDAEQAPSNNNSSNDADEAPKLCWYKFDGVKIAEGYNYAGISRGALVMSNIFLSNSFVFLASQQAGCVDEEGNVEQDCREKVYGFNPASFVSNIAVITGVISAFFMPLVGAIIDYTDYRRTVGIFSAALIIMIQIIQIGTILPTWFEMAVLQAVAGFLYQVQGVATYAYLPDMSYIVGEGKMTKYTSKFVMSQFASQSLYTILITALSVGLGWNEVVTGQASQGINSLWSGIFFALGWTLMGHVPSKHVLPEGHHLLTEGFVQVYRTGKNINSKHKHGLRWFFLAVIFAESGANAFTVVAVVFLSVQIGLSGTEIGVFFLVVLLATIPGSWIASSFIAPRTDPKRSWQYSMVGLTIWTAGGAIVLDYTPSFVVFLWAIGIGVLLGWFYPTEGVFYSMTLPKGQETELSGFYVYCTQILSWLPPLVFTFMVEADISQTYAVVAVTMFFPIACGILMCAVGWEDILKESGRLEENNDAGIPPPKQQQNLVDANDKEEEELSSNEVSDDEPDI